MTAIDDLVQRAYDSLEKLVAERDDHRKRQSEAEAMYAGACVNLDALRAENERLRAAVEAVAEALEEASARCRDEDLDMEACMLISDIRAAIERRLTARKDEP